MKDYDSLASQGAPSKHATDNLGSWGHEFVRSLAGEIGQEYNARVIDGADPDTDEPFADILSMVDVIVPFHVSHNAEAEAVDLLIEVQRLKSLLGMDAIDDNNFDRICMYLLKTADFMSDPEDYVVSFCDSIPHPFVAAKRSVLQWSRQTRQDTYTLFLLSNHYHHLPRYSLRFFSLSLSFSLSTGNARDGLCDLPETGSVLRCSPSCTQDERRKLDSGIDERV